MRLLSALTAFATACTCASAPEPPAAPDRPEPRAADETDAAETDVEAPRARPRRKGRRARERARREATGPGKWRKVEGDAALTPEQQRLIQQLEAIGYADGTQDVLAEVMVPLHDRDRAEPGLNLWHDGHDAAAYLSTMDGEVLHRWALRYADAFPGEEVPRDARGVNHWRRVLLGEGGDLYAIHEGRGIVALDAASTLRWSRRNKAHHQLAWLGDGTLAVLVREGRVVPEVNPDAPVLADAVEIMDSATGEVIRRVDLLQALLDSEHADVLDRGRRSGDLLHTNTLTVLDGSAAAYDPAFQSGHWLISSRTRSFIAVVDPSEPVVTWLHQGAYAQQHDPIVAGGELLLFDNVGRPKRHAAVRAYDLTDMSQTWIWPGRGSTRLFSPTLGAVQALPGGHVLVTESERGHAVEVDRATGEVVWSFYTPHRAGDEGQFIAALFELVRLPLDTPIPWARSPE